MRKHPPAAERCLRLLSRDKAIELPFPFGNPRRHQKLARIGKRDEMRGEKRRMGRTKHEPLLRLAVRPIRDRMEKRNPICPAHDAAGVRPHRFSFEIRIF